MIITPRASGIALRSGAAGHTTACLPVFQEVPVAVACARLVLRYCVAFSRSLLSNHFPPRCAVSFPFFCAVYYARFQQQLVTAR